MKSFSSDIESLVLEITAKEPLITERRVPQIRELIQRLKEKISVPSKRKFSPYKVLRAHLLPLTNVCFNKSGSHFITASYDRTCRLWETDTGKEVRTYEGHSNVVYALSFNNPFCDKIATGSFDRTARVWSVDSGECYYSLKGHNAELVCLQFNPISTILATGSMDTRAKLWDIETGSEVANLSGHTAEVICLQFSQGANTSVTFATKMSEDINDSEFKVDDRLDECTPDYLTEGGRLLLTGSFDHTVSIWDMRTGQRTHHLIGHAAEISVATFSYDGNYVASASMDKTLRVWDTRNGKPMQILSGHADEVLDVCFDLSAKLIASGSADGTARVWKYGPSNVMTSNFSPAGLNPIFKPHLTLEGHELEISKVCFNSLGDRLLTASADKTARLWDVETGDLCDILMGHSSEIFSCAFNYESDTIITGSKDNTCRIWR
ncbi:Dynein assembly factor with WDR repeat domains 1 [Cichlidogyrus casuarinus]|uniref:Dynein assembly factor with WDR repeat domains 1 n=1 Tax=Cichlidogyrus casuarinus TaxID=1844966 RepID=A0ABD2Q5F9_9PLAT